MRVSKYGTHAWLVSANRTAASAIQYLIRGTAGDRNANLRLTLNIPFNACAQRTVHRRPSVAIPIDFALDSAVFHIFHLEVRLAGFAAGSAMTAARRRASLPAEHCGVHTGAGGAVIIADRGAVLINLTMEQTAARR